MKRVRWGPVIAPLAAVAVLAAACGGTSGPGVASLGTSASGASHSSTSGSSHGASPLAYSQCMRAHGITDFPDPNGQGQIALQGGPGSDLDPNNPQFQAAQQACQSLQPKHAAPSQQQAHQMEQDALKFAQCMRAHGVTNFPDPQFHNTANGFGISLSGGGPGSGLDPNDPQYQSAQNACSKYMHLPAGGPKGGTTQSGPSGSSGSAQVIG